MINLPFFNVSCNQCLLNVSEGQTAELLFLLKISLILKLKFMKEEI